MATLTSSLLSNRAHILHNAHNIHTTIARPNHVVFCSKPPQQHRHSYDPTSLAPIASSNLAHMTPKSAMGEESRRLLGSRFAVGLGAIAATGGMLALPEHAHAAAEIATTNLDAWTSLVAMEPKNALSLPTWVIHVASVVECLSLPCRMLLDIVFGSREVESPCRETELTNALSLPTWLIHVASVVEWITAMGLVWRYGDTPGNSTWKGLSWGMVPLLGGAMCACTWHFFYNAQSLEVLVVLQGALTLIGNFTMWAAAFRIYQASRQQSKLP